ncbi:head GIN domain-containing protein [Sinomicrobium weinanense]|uniref:DUF2807 domain-containing protein n=1 Tax=Sinomicrobium weinanense TaxID=2842200 RepID=A0A926Q1R5_9FLAO|nr:head GIN domain-containing protein [Sinomicrobium weinanense]MBC9795967.1 DUF2807 domain-containing protein [Sinomicrobium weinanense]MBU3122086.1 DUF2807 domain-containing protein [Sinomicrobium weinanense]
MKQLMTLCLGLLLMTSANAQFGKKKISGNGNLTTEERKTGSYDKIGVAGMFDVDLVSGKEGNISITAEENLLEYIETEVQGNLLKIKTQKGVNLRPHKKIVITVPFEDISEVSLAGSGNIVGKDLIKANDFETNLAGSGDIDLFVETEDLESNIAGSGDIKLRGKSNVYEGNLSGSGDIDAYELITEDAEVSISGSGDIRLHCNQKLKARVSGSGNVLYKGNPAKEDSKVSGSGKVETRG